MGHSSLTNVFLDVSKAQLKTQIPQLIPKSALRLSLLLPAGKPRERFQFYTLKQINFKDWAPVSLYCQIWKRFSFRKLPKLTRCPQQQSLRESKAQISLQFWLSNKSSFEFACQITLLNYNNWTAVEFAPKNIAVKSWPAARFIILYL